MHKEIAQALTDSIDEITRRWVDALRHNSRTEVHKDLLTVDIVDGVKGMLANLAQAIENGESPDSDTLLMPLTSGPLPESFLTGPTIRQPRNTKPLRGPLNQARDAAASLGRLRHRQNYEIQEVLYEYVKLHQSIWEVIGTHNSFQKSKALTPDKLSYVDRLLDELMLTTVENFYNTSVRDLEKRAIRDPMTQLYNKDYFHQRLNEELRRAVRYGLPIAVAMLDLDFLKRINDTYGHQAGDQAIKTIATAICDTVRQADVPCRYGGDEFAVILPETNRMQARAFADRVMRAVQDLSIVVVTGIQEKVEVVQVIKESADFPGSDYLSDHGLPAMVAPAPTLSIGVASFPEDARNPETLLAKADAALYRAKNEGRNRVAD